MRIRVLIGTMLAVVVAAVGGGPASSATTLCVGAKPGCFATIQAALDAASDGDVISIGPGTFAGGIAIDKSVQLAGTSAASSVIAGGAPVLTIGRFDGENGGLAVGLSRLTITGGFNDSQPSTSVVAGGGIWIPGSAGNRPGATVLIDDTIVTGNRVTASATIPSGGFSCSAAHAHPCAFVTGGGIDNSGLLTLTRTRVDGNVAGSAVGGTSPASYAAGGGIDNHPQGTLILRGSSVNENRAAVVAPNGAFSDGGGIADSGALMLENSVVARNVSAVAAAVPSSFPFDVEVEANAGGLYLTGGSSTTIRSSRISGNSVIASNTAGDLEAESGGIDSDGRLLLIDSSVDSNTATGSVPADSGFLVEADGGGIQVQDLTILRNSRVADNSVSSTSAAGTAFASGGGFFNLGADLNLEHALVTGNSAAATGVGGVNLGGGIANVQFFGPAPELTVADSVITANRLTASAGVASQGGGIFMLEVTSIAPFETGNPFPVALTHTRIEGNKPDQCAGC